MVGPALRYSRIASPPAATTARIGTSHTADGQPGLRRRATGTGNASNPGSPPSLTYTSIPDRTRVERGRREHREDHDACKRQHRRPGRDPGELSELDHRGEQRDHEHVEHRPVADDLECAIQPGTRAGPPRGVS